MSAFSYASAMACAAADRPASKAPVASPSITTINGCCMSESSPSPSESSIASALTKTPGAGPHQHRASKLDERPDGNKRSARGPRLLFAVLAGVCVLANTSQVAQAHRPATAKERRAIDRAVPRGQRGAKCSRLLVSTVEPGYARLILTNARGCSKGDGAALYTTTSGGAWDYLGSGPRDPSAPCDDWSEFVRPAVARDLGLCGR